MRLIKKWQQSANWLTHTRVQEENMMMQENCKETESHNLHQDFFEALSALEEKIHIMEDPKEIGIEALKAACEFYDADWCGVLDVDLKMEFLMPFWWYNRLTGGMTSTIIDETGISDILPRWLEAMNNNVLFMVEDVEAIKEDKPR